MPVNIRGIACEISDLTWKIFEMKLNYGRKLKGNNVENVIKPAQHPGITIM